MSVTDWMATSRKRPGARALISTATAAAPSAYLIVVGLNLGSSGLAPLNIAAAIVVFPAMVWSIRRLLMEVLK